MINEEIRKKMNDTLEKSNGNFKSLMGDEIKFSHQIVIYLNNL